MQSSDRTHATGDKVERTIVLFGRGPLPSENARMHYAPCARLRQLAAPLAAEGHRVFVVAVTMPGTVETHEPYLLDSDGCTVFRCMEKDLASAATGEFLDSAEADIVIGVTPRPAEWAIRYAGERPLWIDLFGDPMAEAQALDTVDPAPNRLRAHRDMLAELLDAGDAFSVVSAAQAEILTGQLGLAGRLDGGTALFRESLPHGSPRNGLMIDVIPCAAPDIPENTRSPESFPELPPGAVVAVSSGGFNTWTDVETLFEGIRRAMDREDHLHLAVTGGTIPGHDEKSFAYWKSLVEGFPNRDRIHFLGFSSIGELNHLLKRADFGILAEKDLLERRLGSSGRMAHWLGAGVPPICTALSELGRDVGSRGLGMNYRCGDPEDLERVFVAMVENPARRREMSRAARDYARRELSPEKTTRNLRTWISAAGKLPGSRLRGPASITGLFDEITDLEEELDRRHARIIQLQARLGEIHHSRMWAFWMRYLAFRKFLLKPFNRS